MINLDNLQVNESLQDHEEIIEGSGDHFVDLLLRNLILHLSQCPLVLGSDLVLPVRNTARGFVKE